MPSSKIPAPVPAGFIAAFAMFDTEGPVLIMFAGARWRTRLKCLPPKKEDVCSGEITAGETGSQGGDIRHGTLEISQWRLAVTAWIILKTFTIVAAWHYAVLLLGLEMRRSKATSTTTAVRAVPRRRVSKE